MPIKVPSICSWLGAPVHCCPMVRVQARVASRVRGDPLCSGPGRVLCSQGGPARNRPGPRGQVCTAGGKDPGASSPRRTQPAWGLCPGSTPRVPFLQAVSTSPSTLDWGPPPLGALQPHPDAATSAVRLAVCHLRSVSSVCRARHRLSESRVGSQRGPGDGGKAPKGAHAASAAPLPLPECLPTHLAPFLSLLTHRECSVVPAGSARGRGPLSCRDWSVHWNRVCSEPPQGGLPRAHTPACPTCAVPAPGPFCPAHSFPASDLSADPAPRARLLCSLQIKPLGLLGVCLFIVCPPSDSRNLSALSSILGLIQIPHWVTISSMNGPTSRRDPALGDRRAGSSPYAARPGMWDSLHLTREERGSGSSAAFGGTPG